MLGRNYVTPAPRQVAIRAADEISRRFPAAVVRYMDASGSDGRRPFKPHLSHGDGREIDLAPFYEDRHGRALDRPPTWNGYGAFEPPRAGDTRACVGQKGPAADQPDPPGGAP